MNKNEPIDVLFSDFLEKSKDNKISKTMLSDLELGIAEGLCRNGDVVDGLKLYQKVLNLHKNKGTDFFTELVSSTKKLANELFTNECYTNALIQYNRLLRMTELSADDYKNISICLASLNQKNIAYDFLMLYLKNAEDKTYAQYVTSDILFFNLNMPEKAIPYLEKYLQKETNNPLAFNTLGHLYSTYYKDKKLSEQLQCFLSAYKLKPNTKTYISNVAFTYNRMNNFTEADKFYKKLMKLNPTPDDVFSYACFLIQNGNFQQGYELFKCRFNITKGKKAIYPTILPADKKLQTNIDLSNKTILIHHEQGFGDSIMFARFVKQISKLAKEVYYIVPNNLVELFRNSDIGAKINSDMLDITKINYDFHVPIMDLPVILNTESANLPSTDLYLKVKDSDISEFKKKYINNNNKIKIGIAYRGFSNSENLERDIPIEHLHPLLELPNIELYSFQYSKEENLLNRFSPNLPIVDLGKEFLNFYDTACALKCMDFVVTSDNVVLNLAGALGVKTYGLFNKYADYRWFKLHGNDIGWYKSVKPFVADNMDDWANAVEKLVCELKSII